MLSVNASNKNKTERKFLAIQYTVLRVYVYCSSSGHDRVLPSYGRVADSTPTSDYSNKYAYHAYGGYRGRGAVNGDTDIDMPVSSSEENFK